MSLQLKRFDSAYPGSMHERKEGGYIECDDNESLAAALLNNIDALKRKVADLQDALATKEQTEKDAARYRWLREFAHTCSCSNEAVFAACSTVGLSIIGGSTSNLLDTAIDAAIANEEKAT